MDVHLVVGPGVSLNPAHLGYGTNRCLLNGESGGYDMGTNLLAIIGTNS